MRASMNGCFGQTNESMDHSNKTATPHDHQGRRKDTTEGRLWISIFLNLAITVAELIGGLLSNSLALLSDALHNFGDTASLGISLIARKISGRDANIDKTFGYRRAEIVGAFINLIILVLVSLYLINEGIQRFFNPSPINGKIMFAVAFIGLLGNFITAFLLHAKSSENLNIRSAYLHILTDGLSSIGVIIGGYLILRYRLFVVDTILTIVLGLYILWHSYRMLRQTVDILMESTPKEVNLHKVTEAMQALPRVQDIHHLHVWRLDEKQICLESHVVIEESDLQAMEEIKKKLKKLLKEQFGITHTTLEFEFEPCEDHLNAPCM